MPLKLRILSIEKGKRIVDAGAASQHEEDTFHAWVEEPKPRRFKMNLAKASASDLDVILNNVGAVLLMDVGEMVQQNAHALYLKPNYDIDVLVPAPVQTSKPEPEQPKPESKPSVIPPPLVAKTEDSAVSSSTRPAQPTR